MRSHGQDDGRGKDRSLGDGPKDRYNKGPMTVRVTEYALTTGE